MNFTQNRQLKQKKLTSVSGLLSGKWVSPDTLMSNPVYPYPNILKYLNVALPIGWIFVIPVARAHG